MTRRRIILIPAFGKHRTSGKNFGDAARQLHIIGSGSQTVQLLFNLLAGTADGIFIDGNQTRRQFHQPAVRHSNELRFGIRPGNFVTQQVFSQHRDLHIPAGNAAGADRRHGSDGGGR